MSAAEVRRAYSQRANLAVAFAKAAEMLGWSMGRGVDNKVENDMDWRHVLYVDLPNGKQVSYHFSPDDKHMLDGLPTYRGEWDGKFTSTIEWHEMLDLSPPPPREVNVEVLASRKLSGFALKRWRIELGKIDADPDISPADKDRILRGYINAWSK